MEFTANRVSVLMLKGARWISGAALFVFLFFIAFGCCRLCKKSKYCSPSVVVSVNDEILVPPMIDGFIHLRREAFQCGGLVFFVHIYFHDLTGLDFVLVPGGLLSFEATSMRPPSLVDYEFSSRRALVSPFLMSRTEVPQKIWENFIDYNPSQYIGGDLPVEGISWAEASSFCASTGLRLPTESEWEFACRAGQDARYSFGDDMNHLEQYAWYANNSGGRPQRVGTKLPNAFGLFDMHGNVEEWLDSFWHVGLFEMNPNSRVFRGGSWDSDASACKSSFRLKRIPGFFFNGIGFRVAADVVRR